MKLIERSDINVSLALPYNAALASLSVRSMEYSSSHRAIDK
jgi:hypothetical protein